MSGRIKGITVVIGGDTTGLEKSLKSVNDSLKKTQGNLKDVSRLLKLDPKNTVLLTQKQKYLKDAIDQTKSKLEALKQAQTQAKTAMEKGDLGKEKYEALQREIISTEQDLQKLEDQSSKSQKILDKFGEVGDKFTEVGDKITDTGKSLTPLSAALAAVGTASMAAWHQMDDAYDNITAKTGATGEEAEELSGTFNKVFGDMPVEADAASDAIGDIEEKLGLTGDALTDASEQFLRFAEVNKTDVNTAVQSVTKAMNDAGIKGTEVSSVLDKLTAASQASGISVDKLSMSLSTNGVVMRQLGLSTTDTIALLATMEKNGVDVASVLTGLKFAVKTYAAENKDASVEIKKLFANIQSGAASAADAQAVFGTRAGTILYDYVKEGKLNYQDLASTIENSNGRLKETFEDMEDPVDKMKVAYNNLKLAGASMGDSLNTVLAPVFDATAKGTQMLANGMMDLPAPIKDVAAAFGVVGASAGPALMGFGTFISKAGTAIHSIKDFGTKVLDMKSKVTEAVQGVDLLPTALEAITSPVGIVIAALAALAAIFITLWNNNQQFRNGIINTWNQITAAVGTFVAGLSQRFGGFSGQFQTLMSAVSTAWNTFCNLLAPVFQAAFSTLATIIQGVLNVLTGILDVFSGLFSGNWTTLWQGVQEIFSGAWGAISGVIGIHFGLIEGYLSDFINFVTSSWTTVWTNVSSFFEGIWNGIESFFSSVLTVINGVISLSMNAESTVIHTVWNAILSFLTTILQTVATNITTTWNQIQNALSAAMNAIRSVVVSIWNGISGSISGIVRGISSTVSGVVNGLSAAVSGSFAALRGSVAGIWNGIRNAILGPINNAVGACRSAAAAISGAFSSIHISVPYIPLPHLSVSGSFSINPPSVPHFGISWYREGGILTGPTIFGMGQTSLLAGGEAGKEAVLPLDGFYKQLESMFVRNTNTSKMENLLSIIAANSSKGIYLDNGVLVGYLLPEIDSGLGELQLLKARLKV